MSTVTWDPAQYERFAGLRDRPFHDLVGRINAESPSYVVDLGCGNGPLTMSLARRWPQARVEGVDSSAAMLARAREVGGAASVRWTQADVATWEPSGSPDVIVTNAVLQWVPDHLRLIGRWLRALAPGGWFAMQVPGNFDAPSHRLIREAVAQHPRAAQLSGLLRADPVHTPQRYAEALSGQCKHPDVWETTYLQLLDPAGEHAGAGHPSVGRRDHPVLEWVKGTALRPILDALEDHERAPFLAQLASRFAAAYPRTAYGVPMPFRRIFAVGHKDVR